MKTIEHIFTLFNVVGFYMILLESLILRVAKKRSDCTILFPRFAASEVAQLNQSYRDIFEDMQGFARLILDCWDCWDCWACWDRWLGRIF
jgi:hypothetical protein